MQVYIRKGLGLHDRASGRRRSGSISLGPRVTGVDSALLAEDGIICMHTLFGSHQIGLCPDQANRSCDDKHMYAAKLGRMPLVFCHSRRVALNR